MNGWHRAAAFLDGYAEKSEAAADGMRIDGARALAVKVWMRSAPDPEALRAMNETRLARILRFFADALRANGDREQAASEAPTPPEPFRVSFLEKDGDD